MASLRPGTNPGTGTAYHPTAPPTVGPYALPVPGLVGNEPRTRRISSSVSGAATAYVRICETTRYPGHETLINTQRVSDTHVCVRIRKPPRFHGHDHQKTHENIRNGAMSTGLIATACVRICETTRYRGHKTLINVRSVLDTHAEAEPARFHGRDRICQVGTPLKVSSSYTSILGDI